LAVAPSDSLARGSRQATAGRFEVGSSGELRFVPRFPLVRGMAYSLLLDGAEVASTTPASPSATPATEVQAIYPTANHVPVNLLKIYLQFSAPMAEGQSQRAVQVVRADNGQALDGVFLPMEPELWDRARTRLTLLLDPGRIKRGLAPHVEIGYPLREGVAVIVRVDNHMMDANGTSLVAGMERCYQVVAAERRHVSPVAWRVQPPRGDSLESVHVEFDRPLDRALLRHALLVHDGDGNVVDGKMSIHEGEGGWSFAPVDRWRCERYTISVDPRLEDLAGNSLTRVFDRDLTRPEDTPRRAERAVLTFTPTNTA
jgi:hypothetical protein